MVIKVSNHRLDPTFPPMTLGPRPTQAIPSDELSAPTPPDHPQVTTNHVADFIGQGRSSPQITPIFRQPPPSVCSV